VWTERAASYPIGRVVTPREVAETILFLSSEASSGINGESITVALGSTW
jgi:NAD(P)-dependent dehydrogenase (short-subunit alcohol dehydrogenase family)